MVEEDILKRVNPLMITSRGIIVMDVASRYENLLSVLLLLHYYIILSLLCMSLIFIIIRIITTISTCSTISLIQHLHNI